jgi:predicted regulator of Ras-like GTPase activity (Roadblock/LC7/MglB family)
MSFATLLRGIVEGCRGGLGAVLMGSDGMPIEQVIAADAPEGLGEELATAGVEFGRLLGDMRKASDAVAGGTLLDVTVRLARLWLVFAAIDEETFLAVAVSPDGNAGQARYLLRRQLPALRAEL